MSKRRIEVGDIVEVFITPDGSVSVRGQVESIPCATGDCWTIDGYGTIYNIQAYAIMRLVSKGMVKP